MNEKMKKLVELATQMGFVSTTNDPNKEEKQYKWLKELKEWIYDKKQYDVQVLKNEHFETYYYVVFKEDMLISDLMSDDGLVEKEDAFIEAFINTIEYMNSPEQCVRCHSHDVSIAMAGETPTYVCRDCDAISCDGQVIGQISGGISERADRDLRTRAVTLGERIAESDGIDRYIAFDEPLSEGQRLYADLARENDAIRWRSTTAEGVMINTTDTVTAEDYFSEQMAELNRVTPFDNMNNINDAPNIAEDGSTQYMTVDQISRISNRVSDHSEVYSRPIPNSREALEMRRAMLNNSMAGERPQPIVPDDTPERTTQSILEDYVSDELDRLYRNMGIVPVNSTRVEGMNTNRISND